MQANSCRIDIRDCLAFRKRAEYSFGHTRFFSQGPGGEVVVPPGVGMAGTLGFLIFIAATTATIAMMTTMAPMIP